MPSKEDPNKKKNHTGGAKNSGNGDDPPDESGRSTRSSSKAADAQRTTPGAIPLPVAENSGNPTQTKDDGNKPADGKGPQTEANREPAGSSTEGHAADVEMDDATVKDKDHSARIADLEAQLQAAKGANVNLQRIVADQQKLIPSGSGGAQQSLVERARDIGFVVDPSGNLQLGPPRQAVSVSQPYCYTSSKEIGGDLTDYEQGCGCYGHFKLNLMPVKLPKGHDFFLPKTPLELARGAAVAEAVTMDDTAKELFYMGTSPAVLEFRLAEPTDDQIVMAMLKMMDACKCTKRRKAFEDVMRAPFKCSATTADPKKAARKVRIAERVRAALDGGKALLTEETIVVGNRNATRFAAALGVNNTATPSLAELRVFLSSHFASCVKQVFIWLDLPDDNVVTEVFVNGFAEELRAAAAWEHVMFVVLPPPYTDSRLPAFEVFMDHFNKASPQLKNVLWLDDSVRYDGYRFSRTLGANEFVVDGSSVYPEGTISSKGAMAAIKLLKKLCSWLDLEKKDADHRRKDHSNENSLHGVRGGGIGKNPARGAPSRGGGGGFQQRGRGFQQNFTRGRGNQSNFDRRRGSN